MEQFKIHEDPTQGFTVLKRVPMNNLPGCTEYFWQQQCKWYQSKWLATKKMWELERKSEDLDTRIPGRTSL